MKLVRWIIKIFLVLVHCVFRFFGYAYSLLQLLHSYWYIIRLKSCGKKVRFYGSVCFTSPENAVIGNNVHIGNNAWIRAEGGLTIGDNCHISRNLVLYTINHSYEGECLPYDANYDKKPVVIGKNVWIGMNVCIAPGTKIGDGVIVGMGTVVSGEVPPLSIIGSERFKILKHRDKEHYQKLEQLGAYGAANGRPLRKP